jgi:glycosyltransferase involved in cell wall biosynthesis
VRVLQVFPSISPSAGAPGNATTFVRYLLKYGVDATVVTTDADTHGRLGVPLREPITHDGVRCIVHPVPRLGRRWKFAPSLGATLRAIVPTSDLVHIHWLYDFSSIAAARAAVAAGVPFVVQPHGSLDPHLFRRNHLLKRAYLATIGRPLLSRAAAVIFTAEEERRLAAYPVTGPTWIATVGVDVTRFDHRPPRGSFRQTYPAVGGPFLLFLGRISPQKGLDLLLGAFRCILKTRSDLWLVVAGPDYRGYEAQIRRLAGELGIAHRVVFTGLVPPEMKLAAFTDAELFVLSSYAENFGVVITEALACGLPVVISDRVNIHAELSAAGVATVVQCDVESLTGGVLSALADPGLRARIATAGPALVRSRYSWDATVPALIRRYREVQRVV